MNSENVLTRLLESDEPAVRYKTLVNVLGVDHDSSEAIAAQEAIRHCERAERLLSLQQADGRFPGNVYAKYTGVHWSLLMLAEMGYPPGDERLLPLRDQVYERWLAPEHVRERVVEQESARYKSGPGVPVIDGRARRCASQEGNALYATLQLGLADERADQLAANLVRWQWADGGWNCDRKTAAVNSSFIETLAPLRGLALHARIRGDSESRQAAERAAEMFLSRRLFRRRRNGEIIKEDFVKLHYPHYWHYDILYALKVFADMGLLADPRCKEALDLLESRQLPDGGFPAERKYYKVVSEPMHGGSLVDWGGTSKKRMNPFVTVDALFVLRLAGRYTPSIVFCDTISGYGINSRDVALQRLDT